MVVEKLLLSVCMKVKVIKLLQLSGKTDALLQTKHNVIKAFMFIKTQNTMSILKDFEKRGKNLLQKIKSG